MAADTTTPPPKVEAHDPLPESNWLWRRVFIFTLTTSIVVGVWMMVNSWVRSGAPSQLIVGAELKVIGWLCLLVWFMATYYMIAPTGEQIVKMWQSVTAWKAGIATTITQTATGADGSKAVAQTTTGPVSLPTGAGASAVAASSATGLPGIEPEYTGPDLNHIPEPNPALPEEAPWPSR